MMIGLFAGIWFYIIWFAYLMVLGVFERWFEFKMVGEANFVSQNKFKLIKECLDS